VSAKPGIRPTFTAREAWLAYLQGLGFGIEEDGFLSDVGYTATLIFEVIGSRDLLLLAHGTGNDSLFTLQDLIEHSLNAGMSVLTMDLPGHGIKSSTILTEEGLDTAGEALKAYLSSRKLDRRRLFAVGYSLGGAFWLRLADREIIAFSKIALIAVPLRIKLSLDFFLMELASLCSPSFYRQWKRYGWREAVPAFGAFRRGEFPLRLSPRERLSYPSLVDKILRRHSPLESVAKLSQNYLLVFGRWDRLAKPKDLSLWQRANPNVSSVVVDRANHFLLPFQESTVSAIIRWMKS
jgi:pimeloyl-ACP methyl ester carboxylesterase